MKKNLIITTLLICSAFIAQVSAQATTSFGVKLNGGVTNLKLTDMPGHSHSFKPAVATGGFTRITFGNLFSLQPELMLSYTESNIKYGGKKKNFKYAGIEIPVYGLVQTQLGNGKLLAGVGPHIGYGFSIDSKVENWSHKEYHDKDLIDVIEMDHWYAGGGAMVSYEFDFGLAINTTYQLSYDISSRKNNPQVRTQTISLGVGYRF